MREIVQELREIQFGLDHMTPRDQIIQAGNRIGEIADRLEQALTGPPPLVERVADEALPTGGTTEGAPLIEEFDLGVVPTEVVAEVEAETE